MQRLRVLMLAVVTLFSTAAHAVTVTDDDAPVDVTVSGLIKSDVNVSGSADEAASYDARLIFARIGATARVGTWGGAHVLLDGARGSVSMLDAWAELTATEHLTLRVGQFKLPTSQELLDSAAALPFRRRMAPLALVATRIPGAELAHRRALGDVATDVRIGAFVPEPGENAAWLAGRARFDHSSGVGLHIGFGQRIGDEAPNSFPESFVQDGVIDVALMLRRGDWWVHVESIIGYDGRRDDDPGTGTYAHVLWRAATVGATTLAPVLGFEHLNLGEERVNLLGGLGAYWLDDHLRATLEGHIESVGSEASSWLTAFVVQASF